MNGCVNNADSLSTLPSSRASLANGDAELLNNINNSNHNSVHGKSKRKQQQQKLPLKVSLPSHGSQPAVVTYSADESLDTIASSFGGRTGSEMTSALTACNATVKCSSAQQLQADEAAISTKAPIKRTHKERRFHRLFRSVPVIEVLLNRFSCAFVSDIGLLLQGHMYVSYDWICFHSNIFGIEKIIEIPVYSIATISKSKTAKIIPNAVCIRTKDSRQYVFSSLISRDTTHNLLSVVLDRCQLKMPSLPNGNNPFEMAPASCSTNACVSTPVEQAVNFATTNARLEDNASTSSADSSDDDDDDEDDYENELALREQEMKVKFKQVPSDIDNTQTRLRLNLSSISSFISWFISLPKLLIVLFGCVFVLALLFCFASTMTYRLLYARGPNKSLFDVMPSVNFGDGNLVFWEYGAFDRMNGLIDQSLKLVDDVKKQLDALKSELQQESRNHQR